MLETAFSFLGLVIGLISLGYLSIAYKKGPEALRPVVLQSLFGILIMVAAFVWDLAFNSGIVGDWEFSDLHHLFAAASILFFANAARKMYEVGK